MAKTGPLFAGAAIWADHVGLALKSLSMGSRKRLVGREKVCAMPLRCLRMP